MDGWGADEEGQTCLLPVMKPNITKYINSNALGAFPLSATLKTPLHLAAKYCFILLHLLKNFSYL